MPRNSWSQVLRGSHSVGPSLTNTTTRTSLLPSESRFNYPTNYMAEGARFKFYAAGRMSTAASAPGSFTFDLAYGSTIVSNFGSPSVAALATSTTNFTWILEAEMSVRGIGSTCTFMSSAKLMGSSFSATLPFILLPGASPAVGSTFDETTSGYLDLFGTFGTANASNSITCTDFYVQSLD